MNWLLRCMQTDALHAECCQRTELDLTQQHHNCLCAGSGAASAPSKAAPDAAAAAQAALELARDTEVVERRANEQYAADEAYKQRLSKV